MKRTSLFVSCLSDGKLSKRNTYVEKKIVHKTLTLILGFLSLTYTRFYFLQNGSVFLNCSVEPELNKLSGLSFSLLEDTL